MGIVAYYSPRKNVLSATVVARHVQIKVSDAGGMWMIIPSWVPPFKRLFLLLTCFLFRKITKRGSLIL